MRLGERIAPMGELVTGSGYWLAEVKLDCKIPSLFHFYDAI